MEGKKYIFKSSEHNIRDDFPFVVSHWIHDSKSEIPMHSHEFIEIVFIVNGKAGHKFKSRNSKVYESELSKGDIFIINPGEEHTYILSEDEQVEVVNLLFYSDIIEWTILRGSDYMKDMDFYYVQPFLPPEIRFGNILKLSLEEAENVSYLIDLLEKEFTAKRPPYQVLIQLILTQIIVLLSRKYSEQKNAAIYMESITRSIHKTGDTHRILGYLERHYSENVTVEQLTKICHCSERQLSRQFKQLTGETLFNYLHKLRIEKAKSYLLSTDSKISDICIRVGFNDISFFNKVFKKHAGISPKEYRHKFAKAEDVSCEFIGTLDLE